MELALSIELILKNIFSHLPHQELRTNIMPVCSTWDRIARSPSLWRHITFDWKDLPFLMEMSAGEQDASAFNRESLYSLLELAGTQVESVGDYSTDENVVREVMSDVMNVTKHGKVMHVPKHFYEPVEFKNLGRIIKRSSNIQCFSLNELAFFQHFSSITRLCIDFPLIEAFGCSEQDEITCLGLKERVYEELMTQVADKLSHLQSLKVAGVEMTSRAMNTFRRRIMTRLSSFELVRHHLQLNDVVHELRRDNQEIVTRLEINFDPEFEFYHKAAFEWHGVREEGWMKHEFVVRSYQPEDDFNFFGIALYRFPYVKSLALSGPATDSVELVTNIMKSFLRVQELKLSDFSGLSFNVLSQIFDRCPRLRKLELDFVHFESEDIVLNNVPENLRYISFEECEGVRPEHIAYLENLSEHVTVCYTPFTPSSSESDGESDASWSSDAISEN